MHGRTLLEPHEDPGLSYSCLTQARELGRRARRGEVCSTTEGHTDSAVFRDGKYEAHDALRTPPLECSAWRRKLKMEAPTATD